MEKSFSDQSEHVTRELRSYIEGCGKLLMNKNYRRNGTCFLAKYGGLSLYDIYFEKRYSIDDEDVYFLKGGGYSFIGNPDHPYGNPTDRENIYIHDDLFDRILETNHNSYIILKVIHKKALLSSINDNSTYSRSKLSSRSEMVSPFHQLQSKRQKEVHDYSQKSIDRFNLIVVNPSPKLTDQ